MQPYYEILDVKYWTPSFSRTQKHGQRAFLKVILLLGLGLSCWSVGSWPGNKFAADLNVTGTFFAIWSFFELKTNPQLK